MATNVKVWQRNLDRDEKRTCSEWLRIKGKTSEHKNSVLISIYKLNFAMVNCENKDMPII